jgi:sulfatase maturation enzyme AslB (radical SAM superfamily)
MRRVYSKGREEDYTVTVDWNLGNACNFKCTYCHPWFKSGTNRFPDINKAKLLVNRIAEKHHESNRLVRFSFVGGEPTLYRHLPSLCRHIKESAWYQVSISTNASASLEYWTDLMPWIDIVSITHHEGKADFQHTKAVVELLRGQFKTVHVAFAMMPHTFDASMARMEELRALGVSAYPQPLYEDHALRKRLMPYTKAQRAILFPNEASDMVIETDKGTREMPSSDHMIYKKMNSFTGMRCGIGVDQIVIDQDGTIRGGWCRVGGALGNVHDGDFEIPTEAIVCTKETCNNPMDLAVPKWRDDPDF